MRTLTVFDSYLIHRKCKGSLWDSFAQASGSIQPAPISRTAAAGARSWLAVELPTLLAVPDPAFALRVAPALGEHLGDDDAVVLYQRAAAGGDPGMRLRLGLTLCRLGRYGEGAGHLRAALPRLDRPGDRAEALLQLAACRDRQGRRIEALAWYAEAYDACLRAGDRAGRAVALRRLRTRATA